MKKYHPQNLIELKELIKNKRVFLIYIDTSAIFKPSMLKMSFGVKILAKFLARISQM